MINPKNHFIMKTMKQLLMAAFVLLGTMTLNAQTPQGNNDKAADRQARREGFAMMQAQQIAQELAFDEGTTAKFTDTYLACQKEIWALGPAKGKPSMDGSVMTEAEAEESIKAQFERNEKVLDIRKKYYKEYSKFLSQKQILRVYEIEKGMKGKMNGQGRSEGPGRGGHKRR